jgi:hypothetical protein
LEVDRGADARQAGADDQDVEMFQLLLPRRVAVGAV